MRLEGQDMVNFRVQNNFKTRFGMGVLRFWHMSHTGIPLIFWCFGDGEIKNPSELGVGV